MVSGWLAQIARVASALWSPVMKTTSQLMRDHVLALVGQLVEPAYGCVDSRSRLVRPLRTAGDLGRPGGLGVAQHSRPVTCDRWLASVAGRGWHSPTSSRYGRVCAQLMASTASPYWCIDWPGSAHGPDTRVQSCAW